MTGALYASYPSTFEDALLLYARFQPALSPPAPLLIHMHGWHGNVKHGHTDNVQPCRHGNYNLVQPEMRGRGDSAGKPDANGAELWDAVDAIPAAREILGERIDAQVPPLLWGGSGGGGNVLGMVGKFPDLFAAAVCECGISDYALWHAHDTVGEFRDELEGAGWIGGNPTNNPEAYLSRGGRTTAMNLMIPLFIVHGELDNRVQYEQATAYRDALHAHGKAELLELLNLPGVGASGHYGGITDEQETARNDGISAHLAAHRTMPVLPDRGRFVVAGYLCTRRFTVRLPSIDHVALLDYDLTRNTFHLHAPTASSARILLADGSEVEVATQPVSLAELCNHLRVPNPADYVLLG